ncbi:MAG: type II toxin-antitoxin system VapC family toxin [Solirubrobacteraceae bacterium]
MILADTSAWVEFDRATGSQVHRRLSQLIGSGEQLATSEPVVMEVISGARDDRRERELRRLLMRFRLLRIDAAVDFDGAARIYRRCRSAGVTPRGMIDCMIASVAQRSKAAILAHDIDLVRVAGVMGIDLDGASLKV